MFKLIYSSFIFVFVLLLKFSSAQITFTLSQKGIGCNHSSLGSANITVNNTNPPYTYLWTTGDTTSYIENLEHGTYRVTVTDGSGADTTATFVINQAECEMNPELFFTPNGDGYNDEWYIGNAQYYPHARILLYNRWGQKVYEHAGLYNIPWNGKDLFGVDAPDATYYYVIFKDENKKEEYKKGSVSIVR